MNRTDALAAIVRDHTVGRHLVRVHPDCPVCQEMRRSDVPEWVKRMQENRGVAKAFA